MNNNEYPSAPQNPIYDNSLTPPRLVGFTGNHQFVSVTETVIINNEEQRVMVSKCRFCGLEKM